MASPWLAILQEPPDLVPALRKEGALLCASLCERVGKAARAKDWPEAVVLSKELEGVSWEALHSGQAWQSVSEAVRRAYAQSQIILAAAASEKQSSDDDDGSFLMECLRHLDMALLMGPAEIQETAHALVEWTQQQQQQQQLQQQLNGGQEKALSLLPLLATRKRPRSPPPLPRAIAEEGALPRVACPALHTFLDTYMKPQVPVILTGCMTHWPALEAWQDLNYLKRVAGQRTVPVEVGEGTYLASEQEEDHQVEGGGEESGGWGQQLMSLADFIDTYVVKVPGARERKTKGYLAQYELFGQIPALKKDIVVPDYCALATTDDDDQDDDDEESHIIQTNAWFGPAATISPTHTDPYHNLFAQVVGAKAIRLFAPSQSPYLYPHSGRMYNNSQVDPKAPDLARFPLFAHAKSQSCILEAGEMLYIPPLWWHHIESLDVSFSVSFWWGRHGRQQQHGKTTSSK